VKTLTHVTVRWLTAVPPHLVGNIQAEIVSKSKDGLGVTLRIGLADPPKDVRDVNGAVIYDTN